MAGLVGYDSSDDEEDTPQVQVAESKTESSEPTVEAPPRSENTTKDTIQPMDVDSTSQGPSKPQTSGPVGPSLGPSLPPSDQFNDLPEEPPEDDDAADPSHPPLSPYSSRRAQIQNLTLPTVPDFDIPPSPPGSPPPALDAKLNQFLDLKKKEVHFNQKLEQSAATKNPALMDKLMGFVELDGVEGYVTTLPTELWDPKGFPEWAKREKLRKAREGVVKEREERVKRGERTSMDFVSTKGR